MALSPPAFAIQPNTLRYLPTMGKKRSRRKDRGKTAIAPKTAMTIHRKCKDSLVRPFTYIRGVDASVAKYFRTSKKWGKKKE